MATPPSRPAMAWWLAATTKAEASRRATKPKSHRRIHGADHLICLLISLRWNRTINKRWVRMVPFTAAQIKIPKKSGKLQFPDVHSLIFHPAKTIRP